MNSRTEPPMMPAGAGPDVVEPVATGRRLHGTNPDDLGALVRGRAIVEGRHTLEAAPCRGTGAEDRTLGRPSHPRMAAPSVDERDELLRTA